MASVRLVGICKQYGGTQPPAVDDVSLEIADGEFFVLLGPSGCGKSTLLRMIAGIEDVTVGELWLDDRLANFDVPGKRNVAMVFQNYALYPHMSVERNIEFPLRRHHVPRGERRAAVGRTAASLNIEELMDRRVSDLSGGQRQRVAVGRALVRQPAVLLMDEPLSNLDALLRLHTREQLLKLHREIGTTVVYVTHDQVEAMTMGDRIGVMREGRLMQVGPPDEVYRKPTNKFVAEFLGNPPMNFLDGEANLEDGSFRLRNDALRIELSHETRERLESGDATSRTVTVGIRPEDIAIGSGDAGWEVDLVENLGAEKIIVVRAGEATLRIRGGNDLSVREGERVALAVPANAVHTFDVDGKNLTDG